MVARVIVELVPILAAGQGSTRQGFGDYLRRLSVSALRNQIACPADQPPSPERLAQRRYELYRKSFPMTEIALPANSLRNRVVAKWVRDERIGVDVRTGEELAVAIAAGIHRGD